MAEKFLQKGETVFTLPVYPRIGTTGFTRPALEPQPEGEVRFDHVHEPWCFVKERDVLWHVILMEICNSIMCMCHA